MPEAGLVLGWRVQFVALSGIWGSSFLLGVMLLSEPLSWNQPVGTAVLLGGVAAAQGLLRAR